MGGGYPAGVGALESILEAIGKAIGQVLRRRRPSGSTSRRPPSLSQRYPGDFRGTPRLTYDPHPGKLPDPGEVAWTWVPFEEDHSRGKDRPVLIVGRDGDWLLAVPLSSVDHDLDARQEAAEGRYWVEVGKGPWDSTGRTSQARVNRIVRVDPRRVRRVSTRLDRARFDKVAAGIRRHLNDR